jgi:glyoxalase family protein
MSNFNYPSTGIHHITICSGRAQDDIDFFTQIMGQRLIKQTILFDGRYAHYHLYYANANIDPGTVMTSFPYNRVPGRPGSGQVYATAYSVAKGSLPFWKEHLDKNKVNHGGIQERFGQKFISFKHPAGLGYEVIEDAADKREGWQAGDIGPGESAVGFNSTILSCREIEEEERFLTEGLGFRKTGVDGRYHRFEIGAGGPGSTVLLYHEPDRPQGSWIFGAGTVHHVAFNVADDKALEEQKAYYEELGYTDVSEIKDRNYFHSIYVRSPSGALLECAATAKGAFAKDEAFSELGKHLLLPPWFEHRRAEIMTMLEPIQVPEWHPSVTVGVRGTPASQRVDATFLREEGQMVMEKKK